MATPMFLSQKIGVIPDNNKNVIIPFYIEGVQPAIVYYRLKDINSGDILSNNSKTVNLVENRGIYTVCSVNINFTSLLRAGNKSVYLQLSTNNSTWSSSAIVNITSTPELVFNDFTALDNYTYVISGILKFNNQQESDVLDSYSIVLKSGAEIIETSSVLTPVAKNEFYYEIKSVLHANKTYKIDVTYKTKKGYEGRQINILIDFVDKIQSGVYNTEAYFREVDSSKKKVQINNGIVSIYYWYIQAWTDLARHSTLYLDRTSSDSNYQVWDMIQSYPIDLTGVESSLIRLRFDLEDRLPSFGIGYKYRLRLRYHINSFTLHEITSSATGIVYHNSDDILLTSPSEQYTVKFNPQITSFKYNITDSVTPTLGGKYPFIRRNGDTSYKTFSIGGLISSESGSSDNFINMNNFDKDLTFMTQTEKDIAIEKIFRDQVIDFLQKDEIKLFRSQTEGTMLVRLSNISLTPNQQLGRRLWSFTAQATEVDDCNIKNLNKYGFIPTMIQERLNARQFGDYVFAGNTIIKTDSDGEEYLEVDSSNIDAHSETKNGQTVSETVLNVKLEWFSPENSFSPLGDSAAATSLRKG